MDASTSVGKTVAPPNLVASTPAASCNALEVGLKEIVIFLVHTQEFGLILSSCSLNFFFSFLGYFQFHFFQFHISEQFFPMYFLK